MQALRHGVESGCSGSYHLGTRAGYALGSTHALHGPQTSVASPLRRDLQQSDLSPRLSAECGCGVLLDALVQPQHFVFGQTAVVGLKRQGIGQAFLARGNLLTLIQIKELHTAQ